jgi:hypothetical protein
MPTEIDLNEGCEPTEPVPIPMGNQKRSLGKVHFPRHLLHPAVSLRLLQDAYTRRVSQKWTIGECVNTGYSDHGRAHPKEQKKKGL